MDLSVAQALGDQILVLFLGGGVYANVAPVAAHHLGVLAGDDAHAHTGVLNVVPEPLAVGAQPPAVAIALVQAHLVQELVPQVWIKLRPGGAVRFLVVLGVGHGGDLPHAGQAKEQALVDLFAVNGHRERPDKVGMLDDLCQHLVIGEKVLREQDVAVNHARQHIGDDIGVARLVLLVQGVAGDGHVVRPHIVQLALDDLLGDDGIIRRGFDAHVVEVGELVTQLIHLPVIGVALKNIEGRGVILFDHYPG